MKTCTCCKREKKFLDFPKQTASKDGYKCWCKVCCRENRFSSGVARSAIKNSHDARVTGERLRLSVEDAMTRFELRLNFTGIERLT